MNGNAEELNNYADADKIDENSVCNNDVLLQVKSTRDFTKRTEKGLNNDTKNFLNAMRRRWIKRKELIFATELSLIKFLLSYFPKLK